MTAPRHFLDIDALSAGQLRALLHMGAAAKKAWRQPGAQTRLDGAILAMVFEKPSMRTRVSFEVAMHELGGGTIVLKDEEIGLGRREPLSDTARVLSRYVDAIMVRANAHSTVVDLAAHAGVPVINGLTDRSHPCQVMADLMTLAERKGDVSGCVVAWCGDCNNVATSWVHAAGRLGFEFRIAAPKSYGPDAQLMAWVEENGAAVHVVDEARDAVAGADCVVTDTWVSMGDKDGAQRRADLQPFQVNEELMARAGGDAIFLHCLPAHRGEEVSAAVIDGPQSAVFDEAENRLHAQKAILQWCLGENQTS